MGKRLFSFLMRFMATAVSLTCLERESKVSSIQLVAIYSLTSRGH